MTDPKWLSDATTIADLLALPEAEQKRWEVCSDDDVEWFGWGMWREWDGQPVVRARRRKQTVTIDADIARTWADWTIDRFTPPQNDPDGRLYAELRNALAALDGDA